jgi:hypothetical protein
LGRPTGLAASDAIEAEESETDDFAADGFAAVADFGAGDFLGAADFVATADFEAVDFLVLLALGVSDLAAVSAATELLDLGFFAAGFAAAPVVAPFVRVVPAALLVFRAIASNPQLIGTIGDQRQAADLTKRVLSEIYHAREVEDEARSRAFSGFSVRRQEKSTFKKTIVQKIALLF